MRHHSHPSKPDDEPVPDPIRPAGNLLPPSTRKKAIGVRPWLLLDSTGKAEVIEVGKHAIMRRTGLPARDLRILDPLLSYPSTVLGRERAIVINLEHIKAIITAEEVLLLNSRDPSVVPFVEELQKRLVCHYQATKAQETNGDDSNWTEEQQTTAVSPNNLPEGFSNSQGQDEEDKADGKQVLEKGDGSRVLPFEFIALEACLEAACSCLEMEAKTLELEAHPALDKLTSKISTLNLERVRQIKSRLVAITGRVQKVRDELEHLLDDDDDMAEMYLTEKMIQQHLENSSTSSSIERGEMADEDLQADLDDGIPANVPLEALGVSTSYDGDMYNADSTQDHLFSAHHALMTASHGTRTSTTRSAISKQLDVEELEMLLEAYFVQIDGTLNKLSTLREYVDDTEDYINIMLDDKQNHLLQMGVMLTTATLVVSSFVVVVGIFGMNIKIDMFKESVETGMPMFLWTVGGGATGSIFLYIIAIAWCKHKRLLE